MARLSRARAAAWPASYGTPATLFVGVVEWRMFFRQAGGNADERLTQWRAFAREFELEGADDLAESLQQQFGLYDGELVHVHALRRQGQPMLVVFDKQRQRSGPTGSVSNLHTFVAVRGVRPQSAPPMRATARRGKALEALEAGRSGARRLSLNNVPDFDDSVSVYTREPNTARAVLTPPVRTVLRRLILAADEAMLAANGSEAGAATSVGPSLVVGQRDLLLCLEPRRPLPVTALGGLLADMLSLHVALDDAGRRLADALLD